MDAVIPAGTVRPTIRGRGPARLALVLLSLASLAVSGYAGAHWFLLHSVTLPSTTPPGGWPRFRDRRPLEVTTTVNWRKSSAMTTREQFLADHDLWRQMHFEDWDLLPADVRAKGVERLLVGYGALITARSAWPSMSADDWDQVPQPIRAMAFVTMIEHWVEFYDVGGSFDLPRADVLDALKAIAMSESWFNHRASAVNNDGSIDIGLGGASGFARRTIRRWHDQGRSDFTMSDDDYQNPWLSTRWMAFWFEVMLQEAVGDVSLATRAWNWGIGRASAGAGEEYLAAVVRRRQRFFEGPSRSPTWRRLSIFRRAQKERAQLVTMHLPITWPSVDSAGAVAKD